MPLAIFALLSLTPALLLVVGTVLGGAWIWAALLYITLLAFSMDRVVMALPDARGEFPAGDGLLVVIALTQFALVPLALWALAGGALRGLDWLAGFVAFGLWLGQVGNSAAHELIHRGGRVLFGLGRAMFILILFGHHVSAHRLVHHLHVGTRADPNSPRRGQSYYGFALRAWAGSFRAGWQAETALRRRSGAPRRTHPYAIYLGGAALCLVLAWWFFGLKGLAIYAGLALHAQSQMLLSDYVQHYGLRRRVLANGKAEPVGQQHSWNSGHWFTSGMMLNAPRHSDHHAHPARPFTRLRLPENAPLLPAPLPAMAVVALAPPLWRRVMDPRVAALQQGITSARPDQLASS
ncbi:MAG: alkane 1-monooxygenase [Pararhodobacter sp.]